VVIEGCFSFSFFLSFFLSFFGLYIALQSRDFWETTKTKTKNESKQKTNQHKRNTREKKERSSTEMSAAAQCALSSVLRQNQRLFTTTSSLSSSFQIRHLFLPNTIEHFHHPATRRIHSASTYGGHYVSRSQRSTPFDLAKHSFWSNNTVVAFTPKNSFASLAETGGQKSEVSFLKRTKAKVIAELKHYWLGSKLLAKNISITFGLVKKLISGDTLSRREHALLVQTVADIFMLIPFAIIVIVPCKHSPLFSPSSSLLFVDHFGQMYSHGVCASLYSQVLPQYVTFYFSTQICQGEYQLFS